MSDTSAAVAALGAGDLVGLPTDTVYGVACDAFDQRAVRTLFGVKDRPAVKPIPILVGTIDDAVRIGVFDGRTRRLVEDHWPGPLTVVVGRRLQLSPWLGDPTRDTIGLRIPDHAAALEVLRAFGPLAVTSANRSGEDPAVDDEGAREIFGDRLSAYVAGVSGGGEPSTVVDLTGPEPTVLRPGPVTL
ncbi:MAG: L-threonylcarbamoyladenylate synthase [Acidimicrobiia bacterium]|nr:L-threonylcarbamoyladenylate synthase [Acidimicrobiia bacterium]